MKKNIKKINRGQNSWILDKYYQEVSSEKNLTNDEEIELIKRIKKGDKAAEEQLILGNLKFVISIAKQYPNKGMSIEDLVNEGNLGLLRSIEKFDETRGIKFISYAVWWIRQAILQTISENARTIRLPLNRINILNKYVTIKNKMEQKNHRVPSLFEIANELKIDAGDLSNVLDSFRYTVSVDSSNKDDDSYALIDVLSDETDTFINDGINHESLNRKFDEIFEQIPKHEAAVLRCYFGLCKNKMSLDQISEKLGLTKERIRQIKEKGISHIRQLNLSNDLKRYLNINIQASTNENLKFCDLNFEKKKRNKRKKNKTAEGDGITANEAI